MAREGHGLSEEVRRTVVEAMAEASIGGRDAIDLHRGSYVKTDEAAMLAAVERTTEAGALAGFVTESAAAGHARQGSEKNASARRKPRRRPRPAGTPPRTSGGRLMSKGRREV